jgi:hypothetical protein
MILVTRQCLNKTTSNRIISKQECMVECTESPVTICSEIIETVFVTNLTRISSTNNKPTLIMQYSTCNNHTDENLSFSDFAYKHYAEIRTGVIVINLMGMNNTPCFPVSPSYSRCTLILHSPWRDFYYHNQNDKACIELFQEKMISRQFPRSVKLAYEQAVQQNLRRKNKDIADDNSSEENNDDCLSTEDDLLINKFDN